MGEDDEFDAGVWAEYVSSLEVTALGVLGKDGRD